MLLSISRTPFPDSVALPLNALFSGCFSTPLPVAAFNVNRDFCDLGIHGLQRNLVSAGCSMVGLAYRNTLLPLAVSIRVGRSNDFPALAFSYSHSLPNNKKVLQGLC
jgi:hypothetical protein